MRKEIIVCDNCNRQLNEGEVFVTRCMSSSTYDTRTKDVCMGCAYPGMSTITTYGGISKEFIKVVNEEFWNIL